jgi:hypothetical protein
MLKSLSVSLNPLIPPAPVSCGPGLIDRELSSCLFDPVLVTRAEERIAFQARETHRPNFAGASRFRRYNYGKQQLRRSDDRFNQGTACLSGARRYGCAGLQGRGRDRRRPRRIPSPRRWNSCRALATTVITTRGRIHHRTSSPLISNRPATRNALRGRCGMPLSCAVANHRHFDALFR